MNWLDVLKHISMLLGPIADLIRQLLGRTGAPIPALELDATRAELAQLAIGLQHLAAGRMLSTATGDAVRTATLNCAHSMIDLLRTLETHSTELRAAAGRIAELASEELAARATEGGAVASTSTAEGGAELVGDVDEKSESSPKRSHHKSKE